MGCFTEKSFVQCMGNGLQNIHLFAITHIGRFAINDLQIS
jgi:hypothetical protein